MKGFEKGTYIVKNTTNLTVKRINHFMVFLTAILTFVG